MNINDLPIARSVMQASETRLASNETVVVVEIKFHQAGHADRGTHTAVLDIVQARKLMAQLASAIAAADEVEG